MFDTSNVILKLNIFDLSHQDNNYETFDYCVVDSNKATCIKQTIKKYPEFQVSFEPSCDNYTSCNLKNINVEIITKEKDVGRFVELFGLRLYSLPLIEDLENQISDIVEEKEKEQFYVERIKCSSCEKDIDLYLDNICSHCNSKNDFTEATYTVCGPGFVVTQKQDHDSDEDEETSRCLVFEVLEEFSPEKKDEVFHQIPNFESFEKIQNKFGVRIYISNNEGEKYFFTCPHFREKKKELKDLTDFRDLYFPKEKIERTRFECIARTQSKWFKKVLF